MRGDLQQALIGLERQQGTVSLACSLLQARLRPVQCWLSNRDLPSNSNFTLKSAPLCWIHKNYSKIKQKDFLQSNSMTVLWAKLCSLVQQLAMFCGSKEEWPCSGPSQVSARTWLLPLLFTTQPWPSLCGHDIGKAPPQAKPSPFISQVPTSYKPVKLHFKS